MRTRNPGVAAVRASHGSDARAGIEREEEEMPSNRGSEKCEGLVWPRLSQRSVGKSFSRGRGRLNYGEKGAMYRVTSSSRHSPETCKPATVPILECGKPIGGNGPI